MIGMFNFPIFEISSPTIFPRSSMVFFSLLIDKLFRRLQKYLHIFFNQEMYILFIKYSPKISYSEDNLAPEQRKSEN